MIRTVMDELDFVMKKAKVQIKIGDFKDFDDLYRYVTTQKESLGFSDIYLYQRCCELAKVPFEGHLTLRNWKFTKEKVQEILK